VETLFFFLAGFICLAAFCALIGLTVKTGL
jgi:hypothetical protein